MTPDFYVVIDRRGIPLDVALYPDQADSRAKELTTAKTQTAVVPVFTADTLDDHLAEIWEHKMLSETQALDLSDDEGEPL